MLGPEEMLDRMGARDALAPTVSYSGILASQRRDLRDRERTLRGAIDWSWKLLQPWEQSALAQCSVFRGGFTLDAAEAVLDLSAWRQAPSGMEIVSDLVDQSLLRLSDTASGKRFSWLRSVHGYASEALEDRGESEATRARHARYFARFGAEPFIEAVRFCGDRRTNRRLFAELENLCSASAAGDPPIESASCAVAAVTAIRFCGPFTRGIELARVVLDRDDLPIHTRLPVMLSLGWLLSCVGRVDEAEAALEAGLELSRTNGEAKRSAEFLLSLGAHHYRRAQHDRARAAQEESLSIAREVGETYLQAQSLFGLANLHADRGETRTAVEYYGKALALARTLGARRLEGLVTSNQGSLLTEGNDRSLGLEYLRTALEIFEEIGDRRLQGIALTNIGTACFELGQLSEAEVCFERAQEVVSQTGHLRNLASIVGNLGDLRLHQGALEPAAEHLERAILLSDQVFPTLAGAARGALALCRARQGDFEEVRALLAKGEEQLRDVWPLEHAKLLCRRVEVEDLLGNAEASHAALAQAQAIAEKLQLGPDTFLRQSIAEAQALLAKD